MLGTFFTRTQLSEQRSTPTGTDQRGQHTSGGVAANRQAAVSPDVVGQETADEPACADYPLQMPSISPSAEAGARKPVTRLAISAVGTSCPTSAKNSPEMADCAVWVDVSRVSSHACGVAVSALT